MSCVHPVMDAPQQPACQRQRRKLRRSLADKNLNVISERLCFAWNGSRVYADTCSVCVATAERAMRKVIFLPEVTVTSRYRKMTEFESMTKLNGLSIKGDALKKESNKSVLDYLKTQMQTGLKFDYNVNWFFHRDVPSYLVLDGSVWNGDEIYEWNAYCRIRKSKGGLSEEEQGIANRLEEDHRAMTAIMESVRLRDVQQIDIIKGPMAGTLSGIVRTTNNTGMDLSAIAITTRNGSGEVGKNTRLVKPMGYQKPVDFYNPRYEVPNNYTLRHTVYWNPSLRIKDGKATFDFLPNGAKRYRISVEGIGTEGQMVCISK